MLVLFTTITDPDDGDFMTELYKDYYGLVRSAVRKITGDSIYVDDLVNDTFLRLISKLSVLRTLDHCRLATYLVYTSRSISINFIRRLTVQSRYLYYGLEDDLAEQVSDHEKAVEDRVLSWHSLSDLWKSIGCLPERHKALLYLKYLLELKDTEIAEVFNISPAGVRKDLTRARRAARLLIDSRGADKHDECKD